MMIRLVALMLCIALPLRAEIAIQEVTSPGGIKAWLVEEHGIPFTALEIRFRGGTSLDAPGKRGAVNLMTGLLEEGTGAMDSQAFSAARDALAADIGFSSDRDGVSVSARFLTENRDQGLVLLQGALVAPRFDQGAVDRVREQVLSGLRADEKSPEAIASRLMAAQLYGAHPYGTDGDGTIASVTALTRDDVVAAHRAALARDRIVVAVAGDITAAELGLLLDRVLGGLPATGAALPGRAEILAKGGTVVQNFPGPQTEVLFGHAGLAFDDPDYFAAAILNEMFGGSGLTSRLMNEVREARGLTYGIGTNLVNNEHAEALMGQTSVGNDKVATTIGVIRAEWARIAAEGITDAELAKAKTYMTGAYPLRFDGNDTIASVLVGMQILGLPSDYPKTRNARVEAVQMADIKRVAARLFKPDELVFVVVGEPVGVVSDE